MSENIEVLTVEELADILKVDIRTIYRKIENKEIPGFFRVGENGAMRFVKDKVLRWIEAQTVKP